MKKLWPALLVAILMVVHPEADARRMGGGKSVGQQSSNVTQRNAAPPANTPGAPAQTANSSTAAQRPSRLPRPQRRLLLRPRSHGAPCWAVWRRAWGWRGWPIRWALVKPLAIS